MDKEYYINLIKKSGKHIENHASDYLVDCEISKIKKINISFSIECGSVPIIIVEKEYIPDEVI